MQDNYLGTDTRLVPRADVAKVSWQACAGAAVHCRPRSMAGTDCAALSANSCFCVEHAEQCLALQSQQSIECCAIAQVVVEALRHPEARNKAFDLVSREGEQTTDFKALFEQTTAGL